MMIGIDVERIQIGKLDQELADRLFASIESEATRSLPPPAQIEALYKFWTLKEAFIKAIGLGLSLPLDAFAFTLEPLTISIDESVNEDATQWLFYSTRPSLDICMALAAKCQEPKAVSVNIQQVTIHDLERLL
jgi:4'-phosphopantetheinyl transferase